MINNNILSDVAAQKANAYLLRTANINLDINQREFRKDRSCSPGPELRSIRADYGKKINVAKPLRSLSPGENRTTKSYIFIFWQYILTYNSKLMLEIAAVANIKQFQKAVDHNENVDPQQQQFSSRGSPTGNKKNRGDYLPQNTSGNLNVSNYGANVQSPKGNGAQNHYRNPKRDKSQCSKNAEGVNSYNKITLDESKTNVSKKSKKQKYKESKNDSNSDGPESIFIDLNQLISGDLSHYQNDNSSKVSSVVGSFVETDAPKASTKVKHNKWIKDATPNNNINSKTPHIKIQIVNQKQESPTPTALERKFSEYLVNQRSPKNSSKAAANENERIGRKDMYQNNKEVFDFGDNRHVKVVGKPSQNREYTPETPKDIITSHWPREQRSPQRNRMDRSTSAKDIRRLDKKQMADATKKKTSNTRKYRHYRFI